jgi:Family of unknown function (DUF6461)
VTDVVDLVWADASLGDEEVIDEIFCLTFVRDLDETEVLRRMGGLPDTVAVRTIEEIGTLVDYDNGYPDVAMVLRLAEWTVVFEPSGFHGSSLFTAASRGTEAVCVLRHDYAESMFGYAVDGELITAFDPLSPAYRDGADPDRLLERMLEVGFTIPEDDDDYYDDEPEFGGLIGRCLLLARQLTGVLPTVEMLTGPLTSAYLEPWFGDGPKDAAGRPGHDGPIDAVAEVRRLTTLHGLTETPGLAEALASAQSGTPVRVAPDSPLGRHVREWLTASTRASNSLNDHSARHRMTDADRRRAFDLGWLARALGAALQPPVSE